MLHEQQQTFQCEVLFNNEHIICLWIQCSHLHSFSTTGMGIGLANRVTLTLP
jgi:hypothetical protein